MIGRNERGDYPNPGFLDYTVSSTLTAARACRSPEELLPLRILDPACGAGALLLRAYHRLVSDQTHPTFAERKEILEHTLCGLDIDPHAVAAARYCLRLLPVKVRMPDHFPGGFFEVFDDLLHTLSGTIRCGNALVGPEIA